MKLSTLCVITLSAAAVVFFAGCRPQPIPGKVGLSMQKQSKVIAKDSVLHRRVRVTNLKAERINGDLLQVKLGLENVRKSTDMWCDIQVVFYDKDGFEKEKTNWQPLFMSANEITFFTTTSLSKDVADFSVLLRNARTNEAK